LPQHLSKLLLLLAVVVVVAPTLLMGELLAAAQVACFTTVQKHPKPLTALLFQLPPVQLTQSLSVRVL
jgi:hypothetical protein